MNEALPQFLKKYEGRPAYPRLKSLLTPFFGFVKGVGKEPESFDEEEVLDYVLTERADLSYSTKLQILEAIRRFARWYYAHCVDPKNEAEQRLRLARLDQISLPKEAKKHVRRALKLKELEKLLETAKIRKDKDYHIFYILSYFGLRKSEFINLSEGAVDWGSQHLEVVTGRTKEPRMLYFNDECAGLLLTSLENDWRTLPHRRIKKYKFLFDEVNFSLHCLRHTFNTHMRRLNEDALVRAMMGHSDSNMTDYYDEKFREEIRDAMLNHHYFRRLKVP